MTDLLIRDLATIINSDMIPFERRGMFQAGQNVLIGFGAILGASLGGWIADAIGWRWCFLAQVPFSLFALVVGYFVLKNPSRELTLSWGEITLKTLLKRVDVVGSLILVFGLLIQLIGLSCGGNELPWSHPLVIVTLASSVALIPVFVVVETCTQAIPIIPIRMLKGFAPVIAQVTNIFAGMAHYAVSVFDVANESNTLSFSSCCHCSSKLYSWIRRQRRE
jgi:MFS family permease